ncbi:MAG: hypothetical protein JNK04_25065, partial [Myxococcales bacterium]|nr:hypothetical protein [Myxococcales bacterium]
GRANANAIDYALIAAEFSKPDALYLVRHYPRTYTLASLKALSTEPQLATDDSSLPRSPNLHKLEPALKPMRWLVLAPEGGFSVGVLGALLVSLTTAVLCLFGKSARALPARRALAAFALLTIFYATAVSVLVSWGDFPRYRYEVDGLYWVFTVLGTALLLQRVGRVALRREASL